VLDPRPVVEVTRRETVFALGGGVGLVVGIVGIASARRPAVRETAVPEHATVDQPREHRHVAMIANANLAESLSECSRQLQRVSDDNARLEQQVSDDRVAAADASRSALDRQIARRDPSQGDWEQFARTGTIRYVLPCASFDPDEETMNRLGLAPHDVLVIHGAFDAARDAAWTQIRPLCESALGNAGEADTLGLEVCPRVILDSASAADPRGAADSMRTVASVRAGVSEPSTISSTDTVGTTFLVMTAVAKDAEARIGSQLGPGDARTMVYGNNGCSHTNEFHGPGPLPDLGSQGGSAP
jgi:hypothetical protein